ncbi:MAG: nucleoside phosphorylase [Alphaproteobacteria bacterium]|nr:nucleoside phosphorylase [Alphaproteobacteria bacterium]
MRIGVVTGLQAEATIIRSLVAPGDVAITGGRTDRATSLVDTLIACGCTGLVSFGIAGGLAPGVATGTLVLADWVVDGARSYPCDSAWITRVAGMLGPAGLMIARGAVAASAAIVATPAAKAVLQGKSGAIAVDMESGAIAAAAARTGLPFLVLRAIADSSDRTLPPAVAVGLRADGTSDPFAVLAALVRAPGQLWGVMHAARDAACALATLRRTSVCLGRGLGAM